jgi:hypothetical protein
VADQRFQVAASYSLMSHLLIIGIRRLPVVLREYIEHYNAHTDPLVSSSVKPHPPAGLAEPSGPSRPVAGSWRPQQRCSRPADCEHVAEAVADLVLDLLARCP